MSIWLGLDNLGLWLLRKLLLAWVRSKVLPEDLASLGIAPHQPVCYVLESRSLANLVVAEQTCIDTGLPLPAAPLKLGNLALKRSMFSLSATQKQRFRRVKSRSAPPHLERIVSAMQDDTTLAVQIIPVSVFWGRSPDKERSWFKIMFADSWRVVGRVRKFFMILIHRRHTFVQFGQPVNVKQLIDEGLDRGLTVRKLYRVLRIYFRRQRVAAIGPDLSHRRTVISSLLDSKVSQTAIEREAQEKNIPVGKVRAVARKYAYEIAADYSYPTVRLVDRILARLWNRLYDGVRVSHLESLQQTIPGNAVVYVPCHRSHIDYLLLSYVLYHNGFVPPHVAAGVNLNLPLLGPILRRVGAFFLRRTFKGNPLYAAIFSEYLFINLRKGVSIEYFVEGTRSRTGRSLKPRPGMLAMTAQSVLRDSRRPVVFIPTYIGYEKLLEGETYVGELSGKPKEKESWGALLRSLKDLKSEFGKVYVSFGEPIYMTDVLDSVRPAWHEQRPAADERPQWLAPVVDDLARRIIVNINAAVAVNPINLLSLALLSTARQAMAETELAAQLDIYLKLLAHAPYSARVTLPELNASQMIANGEQMGFVTRHAHPLGDLVAAEGKNAILLAYFRNNILHLFALPSLIACCFLNNRRLPAPKALELIKLAYPYLRTELFLQWNDDDIDAAFTHCASAMQDLNLLTRDPNGDLSRPSGASLEGLQLFTLAKAILPALERYYLMLALLHRSGSISREELEEQSHLVAQRMSRLYGFNSPEFFDKTLFRNFIDTLHEQGVLTIDENGQLSLDSLAGARNQDVDLLLSREVRHSILQLTAAPSPRDIAN
ncbi:MAG: glycerol-3-phosphate 1-O-acyltransferase PlsB [Gammaproteobacteria bacterium]